MTTIHTGGVNTTADTNYCGPLTNTLHSYNKQTNIQKNKLTNKQTEMLICSYNRHWYVSSTNLACCLSFVPYYILDTQFSKFLVRLDHSTSLRHGNNTLEAILWTVEGCCLSTADTQATYSTSWRTKRNSITAGPCCALVDNLLR